MKREWHESGLQSFYGDDMQYVEVETRLDGRPPLPRPAA